ncbi:MAG: growth inhibitor [Planctomycetota bacterium]|nr:MAG: growth inhibitor [Planctomycetota bacterium]
MTNFSRGEVLLVEIAFSGTPGRKKRPAVVISVEQFHRGGTKLIVAGLTSNITSPARFGDVSIQHWQKAGLVKPSAFRGVVTTVDELDVVRTMGVLDSKDFEELESSIADLLGFTVI